MAPPFRACVFDLDGTLLDSYDGIHEALNGTLAALGKPLVGMETTRRIVGRGLRALIERAVGPEGDVEKGVVLFRKLYAESGPRGTRLMPGADDVTRALHGAGVVLLAASNKPSDFSRQLLALLGLGARFAWVGGPDQGFPPKPDPAMVVRGLEATGVAAEEALFVGDMPIDVRTARAAGMRVAALPTGSSTEEELRSENPDFFLRNLAEVLPLFAKAPAR